MHRNLEERTPSPTITVAPNRSIFMLFYQGPLHVGGVNSGLVFERIRFGQAEMPAM
jgi:hypothetical protein